MRRAVAMLAAGTFVLRALAGVGAAVWIVTLALAGERGSLVGAMEVFFAVVGLLFLLPIAIAFAWAGLALARRREGWRALAFPPILASLLLEAAWAQSAQGEALAILAGVLAYDAGCAVLLVADQTLRSLEREAGACSAAERG